MSRKIAGLAAFTLFILVIAAFGQNNAALVSIPVSVTDKDGENITDLKQADFVIFQDGQRQKVAFFAASDEPLNIALLLDTSSTTRAVAGEIKDAARAFIKQLGQNDRAAITSFDSEVKTLCPLTGDKERLRGAIKDGDVSDSVGASLRDAVVETLDHTFAGVSGRKAIIVVNEGKDTRSQTTVAEMFDRLDTSDAAIFTIFFDMMERQVIDRRLRNAAAKTGKGKKTTSTGGNINDRIERNEARNKPIEDFLQRVSDATGGSFYVSGSSGLRKALESIVEDCRMQYRLGYYPPEDTGAAVRHEVRVGVARLNLVVRARGSYRVAKK